VCGTRSFTSGPAEGDGGARVEYRRLPHLRRAARSRAASAPARDRRARGRRTGCPRSSTAATRRSTRGRRRARLLASEDRCTADARGGAASRTAGRCSSVLIPPASAPREDRIPGTTARDLARGALRARRRRTQKLSPGTVAAIDAHDAARGDRGRLIAARDRPRVDRRRTERAGCARAASAGFRRSSTSARNRAAATIALTPASGVPPCAARPRTGSRATRAPCAEREPVSRRLPHDRAVRREPRPRRAPRRPGSPSPRRRPRRGATSPRASAPVDAGAQRRRHRGESPLHVARAAAAEHPPVAHVGGEARRPLLRVQRHRVGVPAQHEPLPASRRRTRPIRFGRPGAPRGSRTDPARGEPVRQHAHHRLLLPRHAPGATACARGPRGGPASPRRRSRGSIAARSFTRCARAGTRG
jgi:hypothetical protein